MKKLIVCLLLGLVSISTAGEWYIETVDDQLGSAATFLDLDDAGYPHIAYTRYYYGDRIMYAYWDGYCWQRDTVIQDLYVYCESLELDSLNYPHISFSGNNSNYIAYARWTGSSWSLEGLDSTDSGFDAVGLTSLALDGNDYPHISYYYSDWSEDTDYLYYVYWDGSNWRYDTVDWGSNLGGYSSLAIDNSDNPCISYRDNDTLKYARWNGSDWLIEVVDSGFNVKTISLALDSSDYPHISYTDCDNDDLKYARWDGADWQIDTVDTNLGRGGGRPSLALDSSDYPHISYYYDDNENNELKYARWDGATWQVEVVDSDVAYPSLELDENDYPHISYYSYDSSFNVNVKYARYVPYGFHLLLPESGDILDTTMPLLDWEDCTIPGFVSYTLWWGTDPDFNTYTEVTGIAESVYQITEGIEDGDRIYWRVKSIDGDAEEYWAVEMDWYFDVDLGSGIDIVDFAANAVDEGVLVDWRIEGEPPAGARVLRNMNDGEPMAIHDRPLPGSATRYLDTLDKGLQPLAGMEYRYWLEVTEDDGTVKRFGPTEAVSVPEETSELVLYAAYPNPSREVINFVYSLPEEGRVELSVYDLSGRRVATLVDAELTAGRHEVSWSCAEVESGVYLYRLETDSGSMTKRLVVSR